MRAAIVFGFCLAIAKGAGLVDNPIVGSKTAYLDGTWKLSTTGHSIDAQVPGDLLSDLQAAQLIGDPLYELNFLNSSQWLKDWKYTRTFSLSDEDAASTSILVFDGIKMGATISVDGKQIGTAEDQFLRYAFPLTGMGAGSHTLEVSFEGSIDCGGRWMSCTGGWDWAPYSNTTQGGAATFSKGIWKSVYITTVDTGSAAITHMVPQIFYSGAYPAKPLVDGNFADFNVSVRLHFWSQEGATGTVSFAVPWASNKNQTNLIVSIPAGESKQTFVLPAATAHSVKLWWPAGVGAQPMYNITATFAPTVVSAPTVSTPASVLESAAASVTYSAPDSSKRYPIFQFCDLANTTFALPSGTSITAVRCKGWPKSCDGGCCSDITLNCSMSGSGQLQASFVDACTPFNLYTGAEVTAGCSVPSEYKQPIPALGKCCFTTASVNAVSATRRVGFRHFALVTGNDTDPAYVAKNADAEGSDTLGMIWKINGVAVMSRGANQIPMEELEGRMRADAHRIMVQSAVDANMNTLRVWGGGMFLPDAWYDACDEMGVMVYHDMQYAQQGHSPKNTTAQDAELRHQVRRLSHHPSIVMYDGCNECRVIMNTATAIYATFVMTTVAQEDLSRVIWPSCPAAGWSSGVHRLTGLPNGNPLTTPAESALLETHGPYQHGTGFVSANGHTNLQLFDSNLPVDITTGTNSTGLQEQGSQNIFASEFGCSVFSSFESMSATLDASHWGIHAGMQGGRGVNPMSERNYPCDSIIEVYFGNAADDWDRVGEDIFKKQLWQCMIGQALVIKSNIESRRNKNEFGIIVWQFNEIWPTGGWGSIEYGTPVAGQVIGGRWKPLQYWYKSSIFADVMATCGSSGNCYVVNDATTPFVGTVSIASVNLVSGKRTVVKHLPVKLAAGAGTIEFFTIPAPSIAPTPVPPPSPPPPGNCDFKPNLDWHPSTFSLGLKKVASPTACCEVCDKTQGCVVATFTQDHYSRGSCYLKAEKDQAGGSFTNHSVWSCKRRPKHHATSTNTSAHMGDTSGSIITATVTSVGGTVMSTHPVLFTEPKNLKLQKANVQFKLDGTAAAPTVSVTTDKVALFVTFTTRAHGRFSDNAFLLLAGETKKLTFVPFVGFDYEELKSSIRVEHAASYI